ncbi:MAG: hypothetical protein Q9217_003784 [Psora testacea]
MADSSANTHTNPPRTSLTSNQDLGDLVSISEDGSPTHPTSPVSHTGPSEHFDFAAVEKFSTRRSTDPAVSPDTLEDRATGPVPRPKTIHTTTYAINSGDVRNFKRGPHSPRTNLNKHTFPEATQPGQPFRRHSTIDTDYSESFEATAVWDQKAILSLDGGGIRGYSALLIIKELMKAIGKLEKDEPCGSLKCDGPAESSYHPLPSAPCMATDNGSCHSKQTVDKPVTDTSPWLPCHYFDYMAGTSTGGLISIMLGRLRMNIDDCITEYENLGDRVFARSRLFHLRSPLWLPREKYNHKVLEEVVQGVVNDRVPKVGTFPGGKTFAFDENRCRVVVVAYQQQTNKQVEDPYLFRTYKNLRKGATAKERLVDRNPGPAHDIPIWQVARATSAAPTYFKEVKIEGRLYLDGGFGANNPCVEIYEEVRKMNNNHERCAGIIISIGTGKNNESRFPKHEGFKDYLKAGLGKFLSYENFARKWASDSEEAHKDMIKAWINTKQTFKYHRFNVEQGLDCMKLDEWRTRGSLRVGIGRCIGKMRACWPKGRKGSMTANAAPNTEKTYEHVFAKHHARDSSDRAVGQTAPAVCVIPDCNPRIPAWFQPRNNTLETIRQHTSAYLARPDVQLWIAECARTLVNGRRGRARSDPQRWERACFGAWYQCKAADCPRGEKEYYDRYALSKHLLAKHSERFSKKTEGDRKELEAALDRFKVMVH